MFAFDVEKEKFALKPMNCPGHWYDFCCPSVGQAARQSVSQSEEDRTVQL